MHLAESAGNEYFGWTDASSDNAKALTEMIKTRFPRLIEKARRANYEYAGWFAFMLGLAEQGHLPVMDVEGQTPHRDWMTTTTSVVRMNRPSMLSTWSYRGKEFRWSNPPPLTPQDDWHEAYSLRIDTWFTSDEALCPLPRYPIDSEDSSELGAFSGGAVYYIQEKVGFTIIMDFLRALDELSNKSLAWQVSLRVWNSHGLLDYLKAFMIRWVLTGSNDEA